MLPENTPQVWLITVETAGQRLDSFLSRQVAALSRSQANRLIRQGRIQVGAKRVKPGMLLQAGERVYYEPLPPAASLQIAEALPLEILYQDQDLAVVVKPAGLVTHPAAGHAQGTLVNALLHHLTELSGIGGEARPGIVHRLDKDTSGLLLVAKNDRAHQALVLALQQHTVHRSYDALVWGHPPEDAFELASLIRRDPHDRKQFAVSQSQGKQAITHFQVQKKYPHFTWLKVELETGRTHQIRVHCHYLDLPVVGDRQYGERGEAKKMNQWGLLRPGRQLLHAARLHLIHPFSQKKLQFTSPWPKDFADFVVAIEKLV